MAKRSKKGAPWAKMLGAVALMRMKPVRRVLLGLAVVAGAVYAWQKMSDD